MATHYLNSYLNLYEYLTVLTEEQITRIRKIATGILQLSSFSEEEVISLQNKMRDKSNKN